MIPFPEGIEEYATKHSDRESSLLYDLSQETNQISQTTAANPLHTIGTLLRLLVQVSGAKNALEIGTYTGYTALSIAGGMSDDGKLITLDDNEELTKIAKRYWTQSHLGKRIELKLGSPLETLETMKDTEYDLIFFNGDKKDKERYKAYWDAVVPKLRTGGLIVVYNVMWSCRVLDKTDHALNDFNEYVRYDQRVQRVMLTIKDGVTIARKL